MLERIALSFILGLIVGFFVVANGISGNPWNICTEAKAKNITLFTCEKVKL